MTSLSKPNDPVISRRIRRNTIIALAAGFFSAYVVILFVAWIAKEILK